MDYSSAAILQQIAREEQRRLKQFARAWQAYQGNPPRPLRVAPGNPDDNVLIDNPRTIVDKGVSFLFGKQFELSLPEGSDGDEAWLEQAWRDGGKGGRSLILQKAGVNAGVCGHAFVKIAPITGQDTPRIVVLDPATVTPSWEEDDYEDVYAWRIQWNTIDRQSGKPAVRRQRIERDDSGRSWTIINEKAVGDDNRFVEIAPRVAWTFPWSPISDAQNMPQPNEYWGISDLEPSVLDLSEAINRVTSHIAKIVRVHAYPKPYATGMTDDQAKVIDMGMERLLTLPDGVVLDYLEMKGDISASLEYLRTLKEAWHEVTQIPEVASGKLDNIGQLSGLAISILYGPLVDRTETKRLTVGTLPADISARLLAWKNNSPDLEPVEIHWPELVPADPKAEAETLQLHEELGVVSKETIADKLGYDWKTEQARLEDEAGEALDHGNETQVPLMPSATVPGPMLGGQ